MKYIKLKSLKILSPVKISNVTYPKLKFQNVFYLKLTDSFNKLIRLIN